MMLPGGCLRLWARGRVKRGGGIEQADLRPALLQCTTLARVQPKTLHIQKDALKSRDRYLLVCTPFFFDGKAGPYLEIGTLQIVKMDLACLFIIYHLSGLCFLFSLFSFKFFFGGDSVKSKKKSKDRELKEMPRTSSKSKLFSPTR